MKIYLAGMMGSGKTTLQKRWAREGGGDWLTFDFDEEIFRRSGEGLGHGHLGEFIKAKGWDFFRLKERQLLRETLNLPSYKKALFSLGGGTLEGGGEELILANAQARLVWLHTELEQCWQRLAREEGTRPLRQEGREAFAQLYSKRLPQYQKSHLELSPEQQKSWTFKQLQRACSMTS